jgi:hypothetical protein
MKDLLFGLAVVVAGAILTGAGHAPLGIPLVLFGAIFTFRGLRLAKWASVAKRQLNQVADRGDEVLTRLRAGESPDQIAETFEAQYQIIPVQTLKSLGMYALRILGRGQDEENTQTLLQYFTVHRAEPLPEPAFLLEHLDPARNLLGSETEVFSHPAPGEAGKPVRGGVAATRTHLFFFPNPDQSSLGKHTAGEFLAGAAPPLLGIISTIKSLGNAVDAELKDWDNPEMIRELKARLALPGGFAVPWREMVGVRKEVAAGRLADKVWLVLGHGDPEAPEMVRLARGTDEAWVDDWIDNVRLAAVLEGRLLHIR